MLKLRVVTAVTMFVVYVAAVLWLPTVWLTGVLAAIVFVAALEWADLSGLTTKAVQVMYAAAIMLVAAGVVWSGYDARPELYAAAVIWWVCVAAWLAFSPAPHPRAHSPGAIWLLLGPVVLLPALFALSRIHEIHPLGPMLVLYVTGVVWVADIGAYFAGRRWGRHKLAPQISPGKSWEGAIGALALAVPYGLLGGWGFGLRRAEIAVFAAVVMAAAAISIVGDLLESTLKRSADRKDSGRLLPGHGGVLDRLDSLFAAAPVLALGISWPYIVDIAE